MKNENKKCPMCAEQIPLAAVTCEYCGAQFEVTSSGYCQNCHQVREADGNGQCKVCGNQVMDLRVESRLIEEPVKEPVPVSPPIAKTELSKTGRSRLPIGVLVGILILAVIGAVLWFGRNSIPAVSSLIATSTPTATTTFTPTLIPRPISTQTPRPTAIATPLPAWVSSFAEPILSAIANQTPKIQDNLNDNSGGWHCKRNDNSSLRFVDSEMVLDGWCAASRSNMAFTDFVLELDARFLLGALSDESFRIFLRDQTDGGIPLAYKFFIYFDGSISVYLPPYEREKIEITTDSVNSGTDSNHIVIIAKGTRFAFYINDQPLYYLEDKTIELRGSISFETYSKVALDNLKIWDISDLP